MFCTKHNQRNAHLDRMYALIRRKGTGSAEVFADRLGVSVRKLRFDLAILRDAGAEIEFCRERGSYVQTNNVQLRFTPTLPNDGKVFK